MSSMEFRGLTIVILNWGDIQERDFDEWGFFREELHQKGIKGRRDHKTTRDWRL